MNKIIKNLLLAFMVLMFGVCVFAGEPEDALAFFNSVVSASNNYNPNLVDMYSDKGKIIREVIKPDGTLVDVNFPAAGYKKEMKKNAVFAKLVKYKNYYSDIKVTKVANGYKVDALRRPSPSSYKLKAYMVVQKQPSGKWLVVEEMMQTKEQAFLKHAK